VTDPDEGAGGLLQHIHLKVAGQSRGGREQQERIVSAHCERLEVMENGGDEDGNEE